MQVSFLIITCKYPHIGLKHTFIIAFASFDGVAYSIFDKNYTFAEKRLHLFIYNTVFLQALSHFVALDSLFEDFKFTLIYIHGIK